MGDLTQRRYTSFERKYNFIAFFCGLTSLLFVSTPFGRVSMFDFSCYFICLFTVGTWRSLTRKEGFVIGLSLLWFVFACISNYIRREPVWIALKNNMIVLDMSCMLITLFILQKKARDTFLWFNVGNAISGVVSMYIFQNGALLYYAESAGYVSGNMASYLIAKQYYDTYAKIILESFLLPLAVFSKIPLPVVMGLLVVLANVVLLVGARSSFGTYMIAAGCGFLHYYNNRIFKQLLRNFVFSLTIGGFVVFAIWKTYVYVVSKGMLGEAEQQKYESQVLETKAGFFGGRSEILFLLPFLRVSPIIGAGGQAIDQWGVAFRVLTKYDLIAPDEYAEYFKAPVEILPTHSCLVGSWVQHGLGGGIFWCYVLFLFLKMIRYGLPEFKSEFVFYLLLYISNLWTVLFSGFGMNRGTLAVSIVFAIYILENYSQDVLFVKRRYYGYTENRPQRLAGR